MSRIRLTKWVRRAIKFNPVVEQVRQASRARSTLDLTAIGLTIPVRSGDVMIDCGANVGDVVSRMARAGATVHAFEPNPDIFRILRRRFSRVPSVRCHNQGVMDRACTLTLTVPLAHKRWDDLETSEGGSVIAGAVGSPDYQTYAANVECVRLADFIVSLGGRVRLLKLDIEGAEIPVINDLLDSGVMDRVDLVLVETHERKSDSLAADTSALRERVHREGLGAKVRLDWY